MNEDAVEPEQDDRPAQDQEEMLHFARAAGIEMEEEIVIEDIPAFDTLDDGWKETILSAPHVELEIEKEEPEILEIEGAFSTQARGVFITPIIPTTSLVCGGSSET